MTKFDMSKIAGPLQRLPAETLRSIVNPDSLDRHLRSLPAETFLALLVPGDDAPKPVRVKRPKPVQAEANDEANDEANEEPQARPNGTGAGASNGGGRPLGGLAILSTFTDVDEFSAGDVMERLGMSRGQASMALKTLVETGKLTKTGERRGTKYRIPPVLNFT